MRVSHANLKDRLRAPGREFPIDEAGEIVDELYNHSCIDTGDRFHNTFFHEICPLLLIAEYVEADSIIFGETHSRFDGMIVFPRARQKIELTVAIYGQQEALRMELLDKQGHAPAFGNITARGTKRSRQFDEEEADAIASTQYDQETLRPLLEKALAMKRDKASKNPHYHGARLGIVFDDWVMPIDNRKKKSRFDPICSQALGNESSGNCPFVRVFFVGISRHYLFDSWSVSGCNNDR